jgi:hypothetical protein
VTCLNGIRLGLPVVRRPSVMSRMRTMTMFGDYVSLLRSTCFEHRNDRESEKLARTPHHVEQR